MWRETLYCAELLKYPPEKLKILASELAESLEEAKDFNAAATIHQDYLSGIETTVRLLCRTYQFAEATRIAVLNGKPKLLESTIDPGLLECFNTMIELIADCKAQIGAQVPRLRDLRIKRKQEPCMLSSQVLASYSDKVDSSPFCRRPIHI
jgi:elongator complex protein 1